MVVTRIHGLSSGFMACHPDSWLVIRIHGLSSGFMAYPPASWLILWKIRLQPFGNKRRVHTVQEAQRAFENHFLRLEPPRDGGANSVRQRQENKICKAQAIKGRRKGHADSRGYGSDVRKFMQYVHKTDNRTQDA